MDALKDALISFANELKQEDGFVHVSGTTITLGSWQDDKMIRVLANGFIGVHRIDEEKLAFYLQEKGFDVIVRNELQNHFPFYAQIHLWKPTGPSMKAVLELMPYLAPLHVSILDSRFIIGDAYAPYWLSIDMQNTPHIMIGNGIKEGEHLKTIENVIQKRDEIQNIINIISTYREKIKSFGDQSGVKVCFKDGHIHFDDNRKIFYLGKNLHRRNFEARFGELNASGTLEEVAREAFKKVKHHIGTLRLQKLFK